MCGIAGILSSPAGLTDLEANLVRMQSALLHRGPDDGGVWMDGIRSVGLAHRRLSILDLSSAGHQPMISADGRRVICFNGEIYNFRELRADLESRGVVFATQSDTEVLLQLYARHGENMVRQLRGMFAFCLWDEDKQEALLARDPLGIKPLYVHEANGTLAFASELRALCGSGIFKPALDAEAVCRYFETGTVPEPLTLAKEVRMLEAGHTLVWKAGKTQRQRYWNLSFGSDFSGDDIRHAREALIDSVRHHFVSDVPVGVFLSGGIDSTAILALANEAGHRGISSFSITVDDEVADEGPIARRTAAHFGSNHHEMRLDAEVARGLFGEFLKHLDQPSIDGLNTFTVSSLARQHGMKVVLSGLGGDELFGGYSSFSKIPKMLRLHPVLSRVPGLPMLLQRGKPQHRRLADFLRSPGTVADAFGALRGIFSKGEAAALTRWITGEGSQFAVPGSRLESGKNDGAAQDQISELELTRYMRNQLLRDSDVMSMARGLELRVPFVDRVLAERITEIPAPQRLRPNKALLTEAVPEVPEWVVNQKKRGFLFPYQKWLGSEWGDEFARAGAGAPVPMPNWYQVWSVFVLKHCIESLGMKP
ncbi:asparagine synthase (glutamine-hydrolyzing) [Brevifollis gellanilyticus]|uniref:asparagine synthase (glutamine-hydrolyzing) n=1 Tax=Brevifollis gellanilyticus TaxID=748831 RepID=A0A512MB12_9BACT|nr:asparagine synthase (glutamine-hydrolyzing) [Brevifollis gellanilyticus]GEP43521.1 asparagine synthetase B [Brevifollis gellanilyticus]